MAKHNQTGKTGEELAAEYLIARGYIIRDINWKNGKLELDIVAYKDQTLIVVEVKTRSSDLFGHPEDAVNTRKIRHIIDDRIPVFFISVISGHYIAILFP